MHAFRSCICPIIVRLCGCSLNAGVFDVCFFWGWWPCCGKCAYVCSVCVRVFGVSLPLDVLCVLCVCS